MSEISQLSNDKIFVSILGTLFFGKIEKLVVIIFKCII